ncbi:MAG: beta-phosphoglucomutase-like phosphatase (HAD superfamily) [Salibacteraceae bacterium]|jgi:beta-phosphoglucomutase-like phosphatase (HAD superfamily)
MFNGIILDVDGVLLDSNLLKEENIRAAAAPFTTSEKLTEFLDYFTGLNGVPREMKVEHFFGNNTETSKKILCDYGERNAHSLNSVKETEGSLDFLKYWNNLKPMWAVSGGAQEEVRKTLQTKQMDLYLEIIYGGPSSKADNIKKIKNSQNFIFFGDSKHDHEVALEFNMEFVFLTKYTQFNDWQAYFSQYPEVEIRTHLAEWLNNYKLNQKPNL